MYILAIPFIIAIERGWLSFWDGFLLLIVTILVIGAIMPKEKS